MKRTLFGCFLIGVAALSLADRAPGYIRGLLSPIGLFGRGVEGRIGLDLVDRSDLPLSFDKAGHLALWGIAGIAGWIVLNGRTRPETLIFALIALSAFIEVSQALLTSTRSPEAVDLAANVVGIWLGVLAAQVWEADPLSSH